MNADTFLIPFFPPVAKEKGISDTEIGIVFSAFEFSKFISAFLVGYLVILHSIVSVLIFAVYFHTFGCIFVIS